MSRFLDPKADLTFKKVFGEHKHLVRSLLNALLPLDEGRQVESIEYLPPELTPRTPLSKDTIVDVRCEETGGRKFIVEMQMNWRPSYEQRALFNVAKAYAGQLSQGEDYDRIQPVYSLNLINDVFEPEMEGYYHYYRLVHDLDTKKVLDGLHLIFVELPKFKPANLAEKKMQVLWLRFLTEINEKTRRAPQELQDDPHVGEALEIVEESAYSPGEMRAYDKFWDFVRRQSEEARLMREAQEKLAAAKEMTAAAKELTDKFEEVKQRAEEESRRAEAAEERLRATARQMKADGLSVEMIAKYTGLTTAEIEGLR